MRVSQGQIFDACKRELERCASKLLSLQRQAATGKRVTRPSDDPLAAARISETRGVLAKIDNSLRGNEYVSCWLSVTDSSLDQISDALARAKELAISQASATASAASRAAAAKEVKQLYDLIVQLANTRLGNRYVFGGTSTLTPPVERDDSYNASFRGNDERMSIRVGDGQTLEMNVTAQEALQGVGALETLRDLISSLESNDAGGVTSQLDRLEVAMDAINACLAEVGSRAKALEGHGEVLSEMQLDLQEALSGLQDADTAQVFMDLANQQVVYEAALRAAASVINRSSLMQFLSS